MRIVVISDWFAEKMGYAENCLPKALAAFGHDVHVITSNAQIYFDSPTYRETYEPFIGPPIVECGVKQLDGYTLHRLPYSRGMGARRYKLWKSRLNIRDLAGKLRELRPDVVQTFDLACPTTYQAALLQPFLRYRLFLETHFHASVFSPPIVATRRERIDRIASRWLNALVNKLSVRCYPISTDTADLASEYFGMSREKMQVCSLGVDTDLFHPVSGDAEMRQRNALREQMGFAESDIVCVYTGRLTPDKGPLYLAQAIDRLVKQGAPFRGLFVGSGTSEDIEAISACEGCVIHGFVPVRDLPPFYWAADIGVWPKQESTSQLDAAACGLPIVLSDRVHVLERIDGNGATYHEADADDLARVLRTLQDQELRSRMGEIGSKRMRDLFSWRRIAEERIHDYAPVSVKAAARELARRHEVAVSDISTSL